MMMLNVFKTEKQANGYFREKLVIEDVKYIRAYRYSGAGDAVIHYLASTDGENWLRLRKKDNAKIKLPIIKDFPHVKLEKVYASGAEKKFLSDPILLE